MVTATQSAQAQKMDTNERSSTSSHFENALRQKIVGQDEAVQALVELYQVFCAGLHSPGRPVGNLLFREFRLHSGQESPERSPFSFQA
jgi:ATP-dependent Clp protease ATP-binding subunit ClpA